MNNDDSAIIMRKSRRRLDAVLAQCRVLAVRQHVQRAIRNIETAQKELAKFRESHDVRAPLMPLLPASGDVFTTFCAVLASAHQPADKNYRPQKEN